MLPSLMLLEIFGPLPRFLERSLSLRELRLSKNKFNGSLPENIGQLSELVNLDVSSNSLQGVVTEAHFANLPRLEELRISSNSLILNVSSDWVPPFRLKIIRMGSCRVGPLFPAWLQTQIDFHVLDFSNGGISDRMPTWFWNLSSEITYLDLSHNVIFGNILNSFNYGGLSSVTLFDLSNNSFSGHIFPSIGDMMPSLNYLSLSGNQIEGGIPLSVCKMKYLSVLDVSGNRLSSQIPGCWHDSMIIFVINLSNNNLSGDIPSSMGSLFFLDSLQLRNNSLSGELPSSLKNCKNLVLLDLGLNQLIGNIPVWIGESLTSLRFLVLRSNMFYGNIPPQLSLLTSLQFLDLAQNNLSGTIPSSFSNLSTMAFLPGEFGPILHDLSGTIAKITKKNRTSVVVPMIYLDSYRENMLIGGEELNFGGVLTAVIGLDLSNNNLSGEIPEELTGLFGLFILNLSGNHFMGMIPRNISRLQDLESLDLSRNQLSGVIPQGMANLYFLSLFNLSYNNLSGRIPTGNQLQIFDSSTYIGNYDLCGPPITTECTNDRQSQYPKVSSREEDEESADVPEMLWFYVSIAPGFVVGFWGFCGILIFKKPWRIAYYRFFDDVTERFLATVEIKIARLQRKISRQKLGGQG
ncbi:receptor-like protein EIX2 [Magnolia sinica]|uniref:receptor-like protein EIX2 n=1 Tax=Magnolia sinica TaxID=86752 RepID=UPI002657EF9F|nr:receptor-like protein EIX2 [Magnolia sinica]